MRLRSVDTLKEFVLTREDIEAHRKGKPIPHKMTQRGLAERAILHPSFINHLTSGRRTTCDANTAERIAEVLGVPLKLLFEPNEPTKKRQVPYSQLQRSA